MHDTYLLTNKVDKVIHKQRLIYKAAGKCQDLTYSSYQL